MAVLVTGGAGYIGSHFVLALREAGEKVVVLDDLSTGFAALVPADVPLCKADVGDQAALERIIADYDITEIAHFAAKLFVAESVEKPLTYYASNTSASRNLIESAIKLGVKRFIFSSSAAVYGDVSGEPVDESANLSPVSPYGRSKLMTEWMLQDCANVHDFRFVALRYFNVAGADPQVRTGESYPDSTHLIKIAVRAALGLRPSLHVFGRDYPTKDGSCVRDYVQVSDLAAAHMAALTHLRNGGESLALNCGYSRGFSVLEVVEAVKRVTGVDFPVIHAPRRAGDPATIVAQSNKIRQKLKWEPLHDNLEEIVRQAFLWEKEWLRRSK